MKLRLLLLTISFVAISSITFTGCNPDPEATTGESAEEPNINEDIEASDQFNKAAFIQEAASDGMMEVQLAQYVQQNVNDPAIADFAKMLEQEHSQANQKLMQLAGEHNWEMPGQMMPMHQEMYNRLSQLTGQDLATQYIDAMIEAHTMAITKFRDAGAYTDDDDLRAWIHETQPHLEKHLKAATEIKERQISNTQAG